jgi:hypothetical protein
VLDRQGEPIPDFSGLNAIEYPNVDDVRFQPHWSTNQDLASLDGKILRLKFRLSNARLYSFQIKWRA